MINKDASSQWLSKGDGAGLLRVAQTRTWESGEETEDSQDEEGDKRGERQEKKRANEPGENSGKWPLLTSPIGPGVAGKV